MDSDLPKYCFFRLQSFLGKITDAKNIIETELADEDPKVSSVEFISARLQLPVRKAGILAKQEVLVKTPDWLCKKYKIDQEDTFTRKVDHIPATADREAMSVWETLVRAIIGSETAKMLKSMGIPEMAKEEFEKEKHSVQEFLTGGPNPSTQAQYQKNNFGRNK